MQTIKREVRDYITEQLLFGQENGQLADEDSLLEKGIIDSTGVLELIGFIENRYSIKVGDDELLPENLDSIDSLAGFIGRKLASAKAKTHAG